MGNKSLVSALALGAALVMVLAAGSVEVAAQSLPAGRTGTSAPALEKERGRQRVLEAELERIRLRNEELRRELGLLGQTTLTGSGGTYQGGPTLTGSGGTFQGNPTLTGSGGSLQGNPPRSRGLVPSQPRAEEYCATPGEDA